MISHSLVAALVLGGLASNAQSPRRRHHELAKKQDQEQNQEEFGYMSVGYYVCPPILYLNHLVVVSGGVEGVIKMKKMY
jgi:hypothetical protein